MPGVTKVCKCPWIFIQFATTRQQAEFTVHMGSSVYENIYNSIYEVMHKFKYTYINAHIRGWDS